MLQVPSFQCQICLLKCQLCSPSINTPQSLHFVTSYNIELCEVKLIFFLSPPCPCFPWPLSSLVAPPPSYLLPPSLPASSFLSLLPCLLSLVSFCLLLSEIPSFLLPEGEGISDYRSIGVLEYMRKPCHMINACVYSVEGGRAGRITITLHPIIILGGVDLVQKRPLPPLGAKPHADVQFLGPISETPQDFQRSMPK